MILKVFDLILKIIIIAAGASMLLVVVSGVFFRYVLNQPIFWSHEVAVILLLWTIFLGGFYTYIEGSHIKVNLIVDKLGESARKTVQLFTDILSMIFLIIVFVGGLKLVLVMMGTKTPALRLPIMIPLLSVPVGTILMAIVAAVRIVAQIIDLIYQIRQRPDKRNS